MHWVPFLAAAPKLGSRRTYRPRTNDEQFALRSLMPSRPGGFHPEPLTGRVEDWRAGLGRSLCSLLPRPFGCEVSQHLDHAYVSSPRHAERNGQISRLTPLKTAKALGLAVPPSLLARTDEVIE